MALTQTLDAFLRQLLEDHVYWVEREGRRRQPVMHSAPIEVAPLLNLMLFENKPPVILTSATLAIGGRLDYFQARIGAGESCELLCLGSPFDYARQMLLHVATDAPDPNDKEAFAAAVAKGVLEWAVRTNGRTFALFTSADLLKRTTRALQEPLAQAGLTLLAQGGDLTRRAMLETFRQNQGYVLFGLDSFTMANAQGGGGFPRRTVEERVKTVHDKLDSAFKNPGTALLAQLDSVFANYYRTQDAKREEMMGGGDREAMRKSHLPSKDWISR